MRIYGKQRMDTLNLALAYFIQICARIKIEEKEIAILAAACILIASKLDEIDDNLLTYQDVYSQFLLSKNKFKDLSSVSMISGQKQYIKLEERVLKSLNWNLNQLTPYRILIALLAQGIVFKTDKCVFPVIETNIQSYTNDKEIQAQSEEKTDDSDKYKFVDDLTVK